MKTDPRDFALHINNPQLSQFLKKYHAIDFPVKAKEARGDMSDRLIELLTTTHSKKKDDIFIDFEYINDLSNARDLAGLLTRAKMASVAIDTESYKKCENYDEQALWWYIHHKDIFDLRWHESDVEDMQGAAELIFPKQYAKDIATLNKKAKFEKLTKEVSKLYQKQLRGEQCVYREIINDDSLTLRVYVEDMPKSGVVIEKGKLNTHKAHKLAFSIVWLYTPENNLLRVKSVGKYESNVTDLQDLFCTIFLECTVKQAEPRVFSFSNLSEVTSLDLTHQPLDHIERVFLRAVDLKYTGEVFQKIRIEVGGRTATKGTDMVRELINKTVKNPSQWSVMAIEFKFVFENTLGKGRRPERTVRITKKGSNLKNRKEDQIIRRLLRDWGIAH